MFFWEELNGAAKDASEENRASAFCAGQRYVGEKGMRKVWLAGLVVVPRLDRVDPGFAEQGSNQSRGAT